ncbi:hypothetical protein A9Q86_09340 [Flavobacteriales bacterium 33_180_T64]|nr:hypothetical protein A9Q86_09340 [Flavobacteriales bacterium 33_180_T64]
MIITITFILSFLVVINFLLLIFSCNKTVKKTSNKTQVITRQTKAVIPTQKLTTAQLAPTGS